MKGKCGGSAFEGLSEEYRAIKMSDPVKFKALEIQGAAANLARATSASGNPLRANRMGTGGIAVDNGESSAVALRKAQDALAQKFATSRGQKDLRALQRYSRKVGTQVSAICRRKAVASQEVLLERSRLLCKSLPRLPVLGGGFGRLTATKLSNEVLKVKWDIPCIRAARKIMMQAGNPHTAAGGTHGTSMHAKLRDAWEKAHTPVLHHEVPDVGKATAAGLKSASACFSSGCCLCGLPHAARFRDALLTVIRGLYKKGSSVFKGIFEQGRGVLRLDWYGPEMPDVAHDAPLSSEFWYLPHTNQRSWAIALLSLKHDTDPMRPCPFAIAPPGDWQC
jgi:hypothetical protein